MFENVTATNMSGYGICTQNYGAKTITLKNCSFDAPNYYALAVRDDRTTAADTFVFEGANSMSSLYVSQYAKYVLKEGATLTAPEGLNVTTDVEDYVVAYKDGKYLLVEAGLKGTGTKEDPYQIGSLKDLVLFRDSVNAGEAKYNAEGVYVALTADIDLASVENWAPIGTFDYSFDGNFNGNGNKIMNLKMSDSTAADGEAYLGFFGVTANNTIENLVIENVTINSNGQIVAAAIGYPYYSTVKNITVCGDIAIKGGNYTAGVLGYTRYCVNASDLTVSGNEGSYITGAVAVGGVLSDLQMYGSLKANYSNFSVSGVKITGTKAVGGISGIISGQTLTGATVKNVELVCEAESVGIISGSMGNPATVTGVVKENVTGTDKLFGTGYGSGEEVEAKYGDTYYTTYEAAMEAAWAASRANNGAKQTVYTAAGEKYAELGTWGGIDWTLYAADGTLNIAPTKGTPVADKNAPTKRTYEVGEWRETVVYDSKGSAASIGGAPYDMKAVK